MSKGKRSAKVNSSLRDQLAAASEARQRLERRLREAELDRDELAARLVKVEAHEHPAVEAAALREQAAAAKAANAHSEARQQIEDFVHLLLLALSVGLENTKFSQADIEPEVWGELLKLGGPEVVETLFGWSGGPPLSRLERRRLRTIGHEQLATDMREGGVMLGWRDRPDSPMSKVMVSQSAQNVPY